MEKTIIKIAWVAASAAFIASLDMHVTGSFGDATHIGVCGASLLVSGMVPSDEEPTPWHGVMRASGYVMYLFATGALLALKHLPLFT